MTSNNSKSTDSWEDPSTAAISSSGEKVYVEKKSVTFKQGLVLTSGETISPLTITYETLGTLSAAKDNGSIPGSGDNSGCPAHLKVAKSETVKPHLTAKAIIEIETYINNKLLR